MALDGSGDYISAYITFEHKGDNPDKIYLAGIKIIE